MPTTPFQQRFDPLPGVFADFTSLLRSLTPDDVAAAVPGMEWTAGEVGAHVLTVVRRYLAPTERAATRTRLVQLNAEDIAEVHQTTAEVAGALDAAASVLGQVAPGIPLDTPREFHLGLKVTVAAGWANLIGELFVHGHDIARATGRPWSVADHLLEGIWRNLLPAASGWMRPEAREVAELYRLRFGFGTVTVRLEGGLVHVDDEDDVDRRADHEIDIADASTFTLQFPYRRACITNPVTALLASRFTDI